MRFTKSFPIRVGWIALVGLLLPGCGSREGTSSAGPSSCEPTTREFSLFLAGDSIIVEPWSAIADPPFLKLIDEVRSADAAVTNLETVIHEFKGYPQADSGGIHMASPPVIATELAWAGFDVVGHANNHSFDYGSIGVLETLDNVKKAGLALAGSGKDLQSAREPAYFESPKGVLAVVSAASTYTSYGRAGRSRADVHGRPGVNPLKVSWHRTLAITDSISVTIRTKARIDPADLEANLDAVRAARARADLVVFSLHAHETGSWLSPLAHRLIDAGADVVLTHGPHEVRGIEIYRCRPILYGLGDFVYQAQHVKRVPADSYEGFRMKDDATWDDLTKRRETAGDWSLYKKREAWEGLGAVVKFGQHGATEVRLVPVDLGFELPVLDRGVPKLAGPQLGRKIVGDVIEASKPFDTHIEYVESRNIGLITIRQADKLTTAAPSEPAVP